jgi:DMSO reductase anchor subunit
VKGDWSLVGFTVLGQAAVGASWGLTASWALVAHRAGAEVAGAATSWGVAAVPALAALAVAGSLLHLGRPLRAWRATANLRRSWLSREVLAAGLFWVAVAAVPLVPGRERGPLLAVAAVGGGLLLLAMVRTYRMRTVPAWDSWATGALFLQSALASGGAVTAFTLSLRSPHAHAGLAVTGAALVSAAALVLGPVLVAQWRATMVRQGGAARASAGQLARAGSRSGIRWVAALGGALLLLSAPALGEPWRSTAFAAALVLALTAEALGRALFYRARVRVGV